MTADPLRALVTEEQIVALVPKPYMHFHKMDEVAERDARTHDRIRQSMLTNIATFFATQRAIAQSAALSQAGVDKVACPRCDAYGSTDNMEHPNPKLCSRCDGWGYVAAPAAQGVASCTHSNLTPEMDWTRCNDCGWIRAGYSSGWGIASGKWFASVADLKFYRQHGRLPEPVNSAPGPTLVNPYTGQPRDYRDVDSDPEGILCVAPGVPLRPASAAAPAVVVDTVAQKMRLAAITAHRLCYEAMLAHPDVPALQDDGALHDAIHDILRVDGGYLPEAPAVVVDEAMVAHDYKLAWQHDCQGKQDYDGRIVHVSTRYWPPNYDRSAQHTAHSAIIIGEDDPLVERHFSATAESDVKRQVEEWVVGQIKIIERILAAALGQEVGRG